MLHVGEAVEWLAQLEFVYIGKYSKLINNM